MDYEKAYKNALEKAREFQKSKDGLCVLTAESIFPELKESEDKRIRKGLIKALGTIGKRNWGGIDVFESIAWLKKQGQKTSWKPSKEEMDVLYGLAYITNQYDEHKEEVITRLYQDLKREFFNGSSYENMFTTNTNTEDEVRRRSIIQVLEYARSLNAYNQYGKEDIDIDIAWLEKQGEKKAIMNVPSREIILAIWDLGNEWKELTNGSISTEYGTQLDYIQKHWHESEYYLREKQGEQKVPSVEFKAKDWYVSNVDGKIHSINISSEKQGEDKSKDETKNEQEALNNWYVDYVYILDYSTGRIIVAKHDVEESISELFEQLGLKESQCNYMVSDKILSIEYINF